VWKRITDEAIPYNRLHDQGYPSIGCWPCTRAVEDGETDERAGRWSGMRKTECGLHTISEQDGSGI
jgi:phosphoadenosine phosphosulfate reductase